MDEANWYDSKVRASFFLGIAALVSNALLTAFTVPLSVPFGIMGIALAVTTRDENGQMPQKVRAGLIMSIIGLAIGFLIYWFTLNSLRAMSDPKIYHQVMDYLESQFQNLPGNFREQFEEMFGL